jgi:hypothetical protein
VMAQDERTATCWMPGRYSLHGFRYLKVSESFQPLAGSPFVVEIFAQLQGQWEENALVGDERQPLVSERGSDLEIAVPPFGVLFDLTDAGITAGMRVDRVVKRMSAVGAAVVKLKTLASHFCDIKRGCVLTSINGQSLGSHGKESIPWLLGLMFDDASALGGKFRTKELGDTWPYLCAIDAGSSMAKIETLKVGCRLLRVNGETVIGKKFSDVAPALKERPVTLQFLTAEASALCKGDLSVFDLPLKLEFQVRRSMHAITSHGSV